MFWVLEPKENSCGLQVFKVGIDFEHGVGTIEGFMNKIRGVVEWVCGFDGGRLLDGKQAFFFGM